MRKPTQPQAAILAVSAIVVVGLVYWAFTGARLHPAPPPPSAPGSDTVVATTPQSSIPTITVSTNTTPTPAKPTTTVQHTDTSSTPTPADIARLNLLNERLANFTRAYYELLPADTKASRHQRLAIYAGPGFFNTVNLKIPDLDTPAGDVRVASKLEVTGSPVTSGLDLKYLNSDHTLMQAKIPVDVTTKTSVGSIVNSSQQHTTSRWSYNGQDWVVLAFHESGEAGG